MLQTLVFYILVWWFQKIENRKALIARSILASLFAIIYWICAICMLVADDTPIIIGIIIFIPAILFTIRAILDIKKLYYGNTNTANEHKPKNNNESPNYEYKGYNDDNIVGNEDKKMTDNSKPFESDKITPLTERLFIFLEDGEWKKAQEYSERILDLSPKNVNAYIGKLMIDFRVKKFTDLATCKKSFENNVNYMRILQYGDATIKTQLQSFLTQIKYRQAQVAQQKLTLTKRQKLLAVTFSLIFAAAIICIICVCVPQTTQNEPVIDQKKNWVEYNGMTIELPYDEESSAEVKDGKIILTKKLGALTITEFLNCVHAPSGKRFGHVTGGFASANGNQSFIIRNYATFQTKYASNSPWKTERIDLLFVGYSNDYRAWFVNKEGRAPQSCMSTGGGLLHAEIINDGRRNFYFDLGEEVVLRGSYTDGTDVEIKVLRS